MPVPRREYGPGRARECQPRVQTSACDAWTGGRLPTGSGQVSDLTNGIASDQWNNATPCTEWDVRQLVDHVNAWQTQGGNLLGIEIPAGAAWPDIQAAFDATLSDPSQLTGSVPEFGGIPKHDLAGFLIGDLLIHCWDLAPRSAPTTRCRTPRSRRPRWVFTVHQSRCCGARTPSGRR